MKVENLVGQGYDEPGSWGRLSEGWPSTDIDALKKWIFLSTLGEEVTPVPYGSYVLMDSSTDKPYLRVSNEERLNALNKLYQEAEEFYKKTNTE
jgi:hypothetical protein